MNNRFTLFCIAMVIAITTLIASSTGARWWETTQGKPVQYVAEPELALAADGLSRYSYKPGDWVVIAIEGERSRPNCWGEFNTSLRGPITYSYPVTPAQVLADSPTQFSLKLLFQLPEGLPDGEYEWKRIYAPICDGYILRPYFLNMYGLKIKVSRDANRRDIH